MATVSVSFSALPAHVRTARLIAVAVARRAGVDEDLLDEVRLAVGEACSRAVDLHQRHVADTPVTLTLEDEQDRFTVEVTDVAPPETDLADPAALDDLDPAELAAPAQREPGEEPLPDLLPAGFGLAVITGLVDDLEVVRDDNGTHIRMTWPADDIMAPEA